MSDATPVLLSVGLSCLDLVWRVERFPPAASRTEATAHARHGGGPAATAAVAAARFGVEARLWALHGDDAAGRELHAALEREGVDVSGVHAPAGAETFVSAVLVEPSGERWIFPYRGRGLDDDPADWPLDAVAGVDAVLTDLRHPALARAVLRRARAAGVPSVVDLGNLRDVDATDDADVIIAAKEAAEAALGGPLAGEGDATWRAEAALEAVRRRPDQVVAITLGDEGVVFDAGEGVRHLSAFPVEATDTTGAGDVFHGVWAAALAAGEPPVRCATLASVAAAESCRGPGRTAIPTGDAVRTLLESRTLAELNATRWA